MNIEKLAVNSIRVLTMDAVQKANSGHPGMPMGCAPIAYTLYAGIMKHNPANHDWFNRDRFILSAGHGSMLLYSILHLCGYEITLDDIKNFRQWQSKTPGHPENERTHGIETTTGPLGQGFANAVGMAAAQEHLAAVFNKVDIKLVDHYIYGICGDGDMMEGISHEAASFAGHHNLKKLIMFYDDNEITIDGSTDITFSDDTGMRFKAYGWNVEKIDDVNELSQIHNAVENAKKSGKPTLIITKTNIGFGSPNKQDSASAHGSPLGEDEIKKTRENLGWEYSEPFFIPEEVYDHFNKKASALKRYEEDWNKLFKQYKEKYPEEAAYFNQLRRGELEENWEKNLPVFNNYGEKIATRKAGGEVINALAPHLKELVGGSADLAASNKTLQKESKDFSKKNYAGRNFNFGIREHAMGGILNGMALYGSLIPYGATFLVFSDYVRPAIRMSALMNQRSIYVFTHDSIGVGEDGPTHQPVEHLAALRAIPNLLVLRPADANEVSYCWKTAIEHKEHTSALILTRQGLPVINRDECAPAEGTLKGAYTLKDTSDKIDIILMASGSEVAPALEAQKTLLEKGIHSRVVSFPSWELFEMQPEEYKQKVLPPAVKARVSIEAGISQGWCKYVGTDGQSVSIERFGSSAPAGVLMKNFGFTPENVVSVAETTLKSVEK